MGEVNTVAVEVKYFESLIRDSEKLNILRTMLGGPGYVDKDEIKAVINAGAK